MLSCHPEDKSEAKAVDKQSERDWLLKTSSELLDPAVSEASSLLPGLSLYFSQSISFRHKPVWAGLQSLCRNRPMTISTPPSCTPPLPLPIDQSSGVFHSIF